MWALKKKNDTKDLIHKIEKDSQTQKTNSWLPEEKGGRRQESSRWGTHVYLWQIHFDIWQNQYNIVKLNKIKFKKKNKRNVEKKK